MKWKILTILLVHNAVTSCIAQDARTVIQSENMTVCEGNDVTIICGYNSSIPIIKVTWKINNKTYTETEIANNPSYQLIVKYNLTLLIVSSINETTYFQCIIPSPTNPNQTISSRRVTVTVKGAESSDSGLLSFASDIVIIIAFAVILVLCIIITALIMFIVMCVCIRRKYKSAFASQPEKSPYHTVDQSITKKDLELHPNPAYAAGDNMTMDNNPAYKTCN